MSLRDTISTAADNDRIVTGTNETIEELDELDQVVVAANAPASLRERVQDAADGADVEILEFDGLHTKLGGLCGQPYAVAVLGIKQESSRLA
ncbi:MAG: ribosomal L7Ae/L30e/S12e/Gadd45 family protein [Candidatus Nanohaloarchaeota archaeon QJJ-5]|nr:ribosomal L7Ae/L30e/S12e/Gadd45 family protein [Candidatus Nanohaloarchaeota archaeon QJJ-5]